MYKNWNKNKIQKCLKIDACTVELEGSTVARR